MKSRVTPLMDRIIVKREEPGRVTKGGIHLPDTAQERPKRGKVLAVGRGRFADNGERIPMDIDEGDVVLFSAYSGSDVKIDDDEYVIMSQQDVLAVVS